MKDSLNRNHKAVLNTLQQSFIRGNPLKIAIEKELRKWNNDDGEDLEPFCQFVICYLHKKFRTMP
jgi:hypothetical protein